VTDKPSHAKDILAALEKKGGLDYLPRERTPQGRLLDHAADSKSIIKHLTLIDSQPEEITLSEQLFAVSLSDNPDCILNLK
jgi:hypothetical protein